MELTNEDFEMISRTVYDLCGILLDGNKKYLVEARLRPLMDDFACGTWNELYIKLRHGGSKKLREAVIDAITTHETLFFRDKTPFQALRYKALPELIDAKEGTKYPRRIRIWSMACSTGQEPYSIAMVLHEVLGDLTAWDIRILATDISSQSVNQASLGIYEELDLQRGMSEEYLRKYFTRVDSGWRVNDSIRALVHFEKRNILEPFTGLGLFDIVFCRNVAIYFPKEVQKDLFLRIKEVLWEESYLFTGSTEILTSFGPEFQPQHHCGTVFYRPLKTPAEV